LPLTTIGYRFSCDWAGGFPKSEVGNSHLFIVVEHSTRWVEIFPAPVKNAKMAALLFRYLVIARYGAPAEVLTDGGPEFLAEFVQLMADCLVDHRFITPGNPQANGLAERFVQVFKRASAKMVAAGLDEGSWDMGMADVLAAYRCTKQAGTQFSPYELMFATEPVFPVPARERFKDAIDFAELDGSAWDQDRVIAVADELLKRASVLRRHRALAMSNLEVAQHRDTLRYAITRSGD